MQLVGSIIASVIATVVGMLLDSGDKFLAIYIVIGAVGVGFLFTLFTRNMLHKTIAGRKGSSFSVSATIPIDTHHYEEKDDE